MSSTLPLMSGRSKAGISGRLSPTLILVVGVRKYQRTIRIPATHNNPEIHFLIASAALALSFFCRFFLGDFGSLWWREIFDQGHRGLIPRTIAHMQNTGITPIPACKAG